jgi:integrase
MSCLNFLAVADRCLRGRVVVPAYARHVRLVAKSCRSISANAVNAFLQRRLTEVAPITVATERAILTGLWRWAYESGLVESGPRGIVKFKIPRRPTRAWTVVQCCTAVKGTFSLTGQIRGKGISVGLFLRAWILLGYESGARQGDLWEMRDDDLVDGAVRWSQHKTGDPHVRPLSPACMAAVREMLAHSPDGRILGWAMQANSARRRMRRYLRSLGLSGSSKWLRRSGATHIEMDAPGKGRLHLGHRTHGLAERCYIDWSQVRKDIPQVPSLLRE